MRNLVWWIKYIKHFYFLVVPEYFNETLKGVSEGWVSLHVVVRACQVSLVDIDRQIDLLCSNTPFVNENLCNTWRNDYLYKLNYVLQKWAIIQINNLALRAQIGLGILFSLLLPPKPRRASFSCLRPVARFSLFDHNFLLPSFLFLFFIHSLSCFSSFPFLPFFKCGWNLVFLKKEKI